MILDVVSVIISAKSIIFSLEYSLNFLNCLNLEVLCSLKPDTLKIESFSSLSLLPYLRAPK